MHELVPFEYDVVTLREACWIKGVPFFTRRAIGEWLEYANPQKAIDNIVERNPHISNVRWSVTLNLRVTQTQKSGSEYEREYETEVYNPMGFQLIVFESRQPKALRYKVAVAALVWAYTEGKLPPLQPPRQKLQYAGERIEELRDLPWGGKMLAMTALADEIGKSRPTVYRWKKRKDDTGELSYGYDEGVRRRTNTLYCPTWRVVLEYVKAGKSNKEIAAELGISMATISRVRRKYATKYDGLN